MSSKSINILSESMTTSDSSVVSKNYTTSSSQSEVSFTGSILSRTIAILSSKKTKWIIVAILLSIASFYIFKMQSKKSNIKSDIKPKQQYEIAIDKMGKPVLVNQPKVKASTEQNNKIEQIETYEQSVPIKQPTKLVETVICSSSSDKDTTDNDDVSFVEDENIRDHNLTREELDAIDKQFANI